MGITLTSTAFQDGGNIPSTYTCDGQDGSPPLDWSGVPQTAKSLALICDDPDAPGRTWVHWVLYDLPPTVTRLPAELPRTERPSVGGKQGMNDFKKIGYGGPCPPSGSHRYFFKIYALDIETTIAPGSTKDQLMQAIANHILEEGQLMGRYQR